MTKVIKSSADRLRDVSPREFVRARNALAAQLAKQGKAVEARQVRRLRRPSPVVWALNRAAERDPHDLRALAGAVDRLRRAQLGQGDVSGATDQYHQAFQRIVNRANRILREANQVVTPALERRARSTLQAAVADRRLRRDLQSAQLGEEHADPGFAVLTHGPIPTEFLRPSPKAQTRTRRPADSPPRARSSAPRISARREQAKRKAEARHQAQVARETRTVSQRVAKLTKVLERDARRQAARLEAAEKRVQAARSALQTQERIAAQVREQADKARHRYEHRADQVIE